MPMFSVRQLMPGTSAAKLEPDLVSSSHREFTPAAARPPETRTPARPGSGTGAGPSKPHLHRACPQGPSNPPARRPDLPSRLPWGTRARRVAGGKCRHSCATPTGSATRLLPPAAPAEPPAPARPPGPAPRGRPGLRQSTAPARPQAPPKLGAWLLLTQLRPRRTSGQWTLEEKLAAGGPEGA